MLRLAAGVTRLYKACKEYIRGSLGERFMSHKPEKNRLTWLGYVVRREQEHVTRVVRMQTLERKKKTE